jgi:hypothetical protein
MSADGCATAPARVPPSCRSDEDQSATATEHEWLQAGQGGQPAAMFMAAMIRISCKVKPRVVIFHITTPFTRNACNYPKPVRVLAICAFTRSKLP